MRQYLIVTLFPAVLLSSASAEEIDCANAMTQQEMNRCAAQEHADADAQLNRTWRQARALAREIDADQSDDLKGAEKALLAAQRGWIAYRDGHCDVAGFQARGGSMEPMLVSGCLADLTRRRTRELQDFISGPEQ